jgi:hypothetical protein
MDSARNDKDWYIESADHRSSRSELRRNTSAAPGIEFSTRKHHSSRTLNIPPHILRIVRIFGKAELNAREVEVTLLLIIVCSDHSRY